MGIVRGQSRFVPTTPRMSGAGAGIVAQPRWGAGSQGTATSLRADIPIRCGRTTWAHRASDGRVTSKQVVQHG